MYWGVACMDLMDRLSDMDREGIIQFLVDCQDSESGGFRPVQNHDPHLLNTLSAVQVAAIFDCLDKIDRDGVVKYVKSLQQEDGNFWPSTPSGTRPPRLVVGREAITIWGAEWQTG